MSVNKNYVSGNYTVGFHVSLEELKRYHSLTPEQKQLIRAVVKALIHKPDLLNESLNESAYFLKLLTSKAISHYVCPLCLTPFSSSLALKQHIRYAEHTKVCPICKKEFAKTEALLDHVCKKHNICVS